jgi:hypothetical protein
MQLVCSERATNAGERSRTLSKSNSSLALEFFPAAKKKHRKKKRQPERPIHLEETKDPDQASPSRPAKPPDPESDKDCG